MMANARDKHIVRTTSCANKAHARNAGATRDSDGRPSASMANVMCYSDERYQNCARLLLDGTYTCERDRVSECLAEECPPRDPGECRGSLALGHLLGQQEKKCEINKAGKSSVCTSKNQLSLAVRNGVEVRTGGDLVIERPRTEAFSALYFVHDPAFPTEQHAVHDKFGPPHRRRARRMLQLFLELPHLLLRYMRRLQLRVNREGTRRLG